MQLEQKCRMVGLHSLFIDGNEGTNQERHVVFCDLDRSPHRRDPLKEPKAFKDAVQHQMQRFGVSVAYLFKTLKGVHVVSPCLMARRDAERFEEALEEWGADGFHRFMGYKNGGTVIRVTPKPGEGRIQLLGTITCPGHLPLSGPHLDFLSDLYPISKPPGVLMRGCGEVRLEAYDTVARPENA